MVDELSSGSGGYGGGSCFVTVLKRPCENSVEYPKHQILLRVPPEFFNERGGG